MGTTSTPTCGHWIRQGVSRSWCRMCRTGRPGMPFAIGCGVPPARAARATIPARWLFYRKLIIFRCYQGQAFFWVWFVVFFWFFFFVFFVFLFFFCLLFF